MEKNFSQCLHNIETEIPHPHNPNKIEPWHKRRDFNVLQLTILQMQCTAIQRDQSIGFLSETSSTCI